MSEFVGATAAGLVGDKDEWTDVDDQEEESGAVEGFEGWGAMAPPKAQLPKGVSQTQNAAAATGGSMSQHVGESDGGTGPGTTGEFYEHSKNPSMGETWSWGAAWSAFATAVQQDVKEIAGSVKKSVTTLRDEFQHEEKPAMLPGEVPDHDERELSEGSDKELDAGLGAIDQQVDQIASAAGKALGSLWTGIGGAISSTAQAASSVAGQLEQAAMHATGTNGRRSAPWPPRAFGSRSQGPWVLPRDGTQEDEWQVLDLLGSPATSVAASFDQLFKLYRGHRFSEELEALGNEAARSCNRVRTQLPELQRSELDHVVALTAAAVDLLATVAPTQDAHSAARALIHDIPSSSRHLEKGELPVAQRGGPREGLASMCAAAVDRAVHMRDSLSTESPQKAWEGLCRVRAEGLKLLAEFTALSIQHMAFLAMCLEGGDAEAAGLQFLPDGSNKGAVVRDVLLQLLSDTDAIFEAFYTALEQATEDEEFAAMLLDQPNDDGSDIAAEELGIPQQQSSLSEISGGSQRDASLQPNMALVVGELKGGLLVGVKAAVDRIMQGSRNLVYPICAPAAVRLDAETGLTPVGDIGQQPYEHVSNPERSGDPDEGSGPMTRHRTTSLSNPLFESVGAVPSHMASHESTSGVETVVEASDSQLTPTVDVPFPEASSPLTGGAPGNAEVATHTALVEEEDSFTQVQPPRLGSDSNATASEQTAAPQAPPVQQESGTSDAVVEAEEPAAVEEPEVEKTSISESAPTVPQGDEEDNIENSAPVNATVIEEGVKQDASQGKAGDEGSLVEGKAADESEAADEVAAGTVEPAAPSQPTNEDDKSSAVASAAAAPAPADTVKEAFSRAEADAPAEDVDAPSPKDVEDAAISGETIADKEAVQEVAAEQGATGSTQ